MTARDRLAAWADRRLLPGVVILLLVIDIGMALNWLLSPADRLTGAGYTVAKGLASMSTYGAILAIATIAAVLVTIRRGRSWHSGYLIGGVLAAFWLYWAVMFGLAPLGVRGASFAGAIFALPICLLHVLSGLALTHRPVEPRE